MESYDYYSLCITLTALLLLLNSIFLHPLHNDANICLGCFEPHKEVTLLVSFIIEQVRNLSLLNNIFIIVR